MREVWRIYKDDVKRMTSNIAAIIIVIGLTVIPGLFTWFNVCACWDPFDNTGNLKFAIANDDEGYKGDLLPMKINVGDEIVNSLRANSQLDWTFTTSAKAIDGTKAGTYYAAVVIPKDFSKTMLTFFSSDAEHATLEYYDNEKLNALAPHVTSEGADSMSSEINETFAKTIMDTALNLAQTMLDQLDKPEAQSRLKDFNGNLSDLSGTLTQSASMLRSYGSLTDTAQTLLDSSQELVKQADSSATDAQKEIDSAKSAVSDVSGALDTSVAAVGTALQSSQSSLAALGTRIDTLMGDVDGDANTAATGLDNLATSVRTQASRYGSLHDDLQSLLDQSKLPADSTARTSLQGVIDRVGATRDTLNTLAGKLTSAAGDVRGKVSNGSDERAQTKQLAAQAKAAVTGLSSDFDTTVKPGLEQINGAFTSAGTQLADTASSLKSAVGDLDGTTADAKTQLDSVKSQLDSAASELDAAGKKLDDFSGQLSKALDSGSMDAIKQVIGSGSGTLAATLAAPVELETHALFPVESFGAALTPFYTFIPLFVGSTLLIVTFKSTLDKKRRQELGNPKAWQTYLGHYGIFGTIALMQATFSLGGSLLFIRVGAVHPWLFMLTGWLCAIVYSLLTYTLVATFGNVGKAVCVFVLVIQITCANGTYPVPILPHYVSLISPFLPATYAIKAMRGAMCGIYGNQYWTAMGQLALFIVPTLLVGLALRRPLLKFNDWVAEKAEATKLLG
ncbi:MAG: YhgE/Pip domain-containing protein [Bifidobacterium sp.]|nr:YhgE/Pip domain-containing protein [Bifidobacterium sp.]